MPWRIAIKAEEAQWRKYFGGSNAGVSGCAWLQSSKRSAAGGGYLRPLGVAAAYLTGGSAENINVAAATKTLAAAKHSSKIWRRHQLRRQLRHHQ